MPQRFNFQSDRTSVTAVVARSVFGNIPEDRVALVLDASGGMESYLGEVRSSLSSVLRKQFQNSEKLFNLIAYTNQPVPWRADLCAASVPENISEALNFVSQQLCVGTGTDLFRALELAFKSQSVDAVYVVSDGKIHSDDRFILRVKQLYYAHPNRPKVNTIALNCVPRRKGWRYMQAVSLLTHGTFRSVSLEQEQQVPLQGLGSKQSAAGGMREMRTLARTRDPERL